MNILNAKDMTRKVFALSFGARIRQAERGKKRTDNPLEKGMNRYQTACLIRKR